MTKIRPKLGQSEAVSEVWKRSLRKQFSRERGGEDGVQCGPISRTATRAARTAWNLGNAEMRRQDRVGPGEENVGCINPGILIPL